MDGDGNGAECRYCRYYDPADGYCVMQTDYRRETDLCDAYEVPRRWLFLMPVKEGGHDADG